MFPQKSTTTLLPSRRDDPHFTLRTDATPSHQSIDLGRYRRILLLTEGHSEPQYAKTATQVLRYRPDDVAAVVDSQHAGQTAEEVFGVGGSIPICESVLQPDQADAVFLGIAPPGGKLPASWEDCLIEALGRGLPIVSGLHTRLSENPRIAAASNHTPLVDVRHNAHSRVATALQPRPGCTRILTVGSDCSVGKMSAAKEIELGLSARGRDVAFLATGQTGLMIGGRGVVIDAVVSDFVNGVIEQLVTNHEHHDLLLIEGQGSIVHPAYSAVSTGLLHGAAPDAMILCHEVGRERVKSLRHIPVEPLDRLIKLHEDFAAVRRPCPVVGLALNTRYLDPAEASIQVQRLSDELELPACDVYRDGPDRLLDAIETFEAARGVRLGLTSPAGSVN